MLNDPVEVETCNGGIVYVTHIRLIKLDVLIINDEGHDEEVSLTIKEVYFCPEMNTNLLSLGIFVRNGLSLGIGSLKETTPVTDDEGDIIMEGLLVDTLFKLRLSNSDDIKACEGTHTGTRRWVISTSLT